MSEEGQGGGCKLTRATTEWPCDRTWRSERKESLPPEMRQMVWRGGDGIVNCESRKYLCIYQGLDVKLGCLFDARCMVAGLSEMVRGQ